MARDKEIDKARVREWAKKNPEKRRAANARWAAENPDKIAQYNANRALNHKVKKYGLAKTDIIEFLQNNCFCAICGSEAKYIDHSHSTGKIRGVLCRTCNSMLGFAYDNPRILRNAALYLEEKDT